MTPNICSLLDVTDHTDDAQQARKKYTQQRRNSTTQAGLKWNQPKGFRMFINETKASLEADEEINEDLGSNPEADSFAYMRALVEGLFLLGKLPNSLATIRERLPLELYYVIERTIQEVDQRHEKTINLQDRRPTASSTASTTGSGLSSSHRPPDLIGISSKEDQAVVLQDLLVSLYRKFETIIQGHFFVLTVVQEIQKKNPALDLRDGTVLKVKALLYDYLTNSERNVQFSNSITSVNEIMKDRKRTKERSSKQLFRITGAGDMDVLKKYEDMYTALSPPPSLSLATKSVSEDSTAATSPNTTNLNTTTDPSSLPAGTLGGFGTGGMAGQGLAGKVTSASAAMGIVDKYANVVTVAAAGTASHRLLVNADAYNVLIAFVPTCEFISRIEDTLIMR
ncbi:hypothetical protein HK102_014021 [Quaeritorhiza haematococci]|nr:hypothetical protein HK102_014021 [Quaeritorhiza haematococci]